MQNGKSAEEAANYVAQMRDWLNSQPHLPKNLDSFAAASHALYLGKNMYTLTKFYILAYSEIVLQSRNRKTVHTFDSRPSRTFTRVYNIREQIPNYEQFRKKKRQTTFTNININGLKPSKDDDLLLRFAHSCYYDLEKAKTAAELFFTIRTSIPDLINNRDPLSPTMQKALSITNLAQMPISGNRCLWIWQVNDPGLENYDYAKDAKLFFLVTDLAFLTDNSLCEADVIIMDVKDISLKFLTKFNVSIARKLSKYQQEALPIRLKQVHLINAPPFIDKLFALLKPMLKKEITELVHFHPPNSNTLYKYLDKEDLPEDFGGTQTSLREQMKSVMEKLKKNRELLLTNNLWTAIDKKGKKKVEAVTEIDSFRSLSID